MILAVAQQSAFADGTIAGQWGGEHACQTPTAPEPILINWFKPQRIPRYLAATHDLQRLTVHQFINPITLAIVVGVQSDLIIPGHQRFIRIFRRLLDRLPGKIDENL